MGQRLPLKVAALQRVLRGKGKDVFTDQRAVPGQKKVPCGELNRGAESSEDTREFDATRVFWGAGYLKR